MKRTISLLLGILLLVPMLLSAPSAGAQNTVSDVYMICGSGRYMVDGQLLDFDAQNANVRPVILKNRTLVPLRALSEIFGLDVDYDTQNREAVVKSQTQTARFPIDSNKIYIDGVEKIIDTNAVIIQDRTMVPLRVISEELMSLNVDYSEGLIYVGKNTPALTQNANLVADTKVKIGSVLYFSSLEQMQEYIIQNRANTRLRYKNYDVDISDAPTNEKALTPADTADMNSAVSDAVPAPEAEFTGAQAASDEARGDAGYTETNTQVQGVDEADIVKTDGRYIYKMNSGSGTVSIIDTKDGIKEIGTISWEDVDYRVFEGASFSGIHGDMYISENRLVVVGNRYRYNKTSADGMAPGPIESYALVLVFDTTDKTNPTLFNWYEVDGYLQSSRKTGDILYVVSNKYFYSDMPVPVCRAMDSQTSQMAVEDIAYCPGYVEDESMTIISALNINKTAKPETTAILGNVETMYQNKNSMYLASTKYDWSSDNYSVQTLFSKFSIEGTTVRYVAATKVDGYLLNQFAMDETDGIFRTAMTDADNTSGVFTFDADMNPLGSVTGLAEGERIYSVRFVGDVGYVVTFEQIDPLFVIDLSNPANPVVKGQLKIPGFSNYLHPVAPGRLLGIGRDTQEMFVKNKDGVDEVVGIREYGIKLSLFDVSDMYNPKEIDVLVVGDQSTYSSVLHNHKALMYSTTQNLFGFYVEGSTNTGKNGWEYYAQGHLFGLENDKIVQKGSFDTQEFAYDDRMCIIGNVLYSVERGALVAYDLDTLKEVDRIKIENDRNYSDDAIVYQIDE